MLEQSVHAQQGLDGVEAWDRGFQARRAWEFRDAFV
jgi:hypothetical protein